MAVDRSLFLRWAARRGAAHPVIATAVWALFAFVLGVLVDAGNSGGSASLLSVVLVGGLFSAVTTPAFLRGCRKIRRKGEHA